eukprot:7675695-Lingulodinium_polyedra.AAC.1
MAARMDLGWSGFPNKRCNGPRKKERDAGKTHKGTKFPRDLPLNVRLKYRRHTSRARPGSADGP